MTKNLEKDNSDWQAEYEQLSEDYSFFVTMGWQVTVAVLAVDGLVLATTLNNSVLFALAPR